MSLSAVALFLATEDWVNVSKAFIDSKGLFESKSEKLPSETKYWIGFLVSIPLKLSLKYSSKEVVA